MCFSAKILMELLLLLTLMPAVLLAGPTEPYNHTNSTLSVFKTTASPVIPHVNRDTSTPATKHSPPELTRLKVDWDKSRPCQGKFLLLSVTTTKRLCVSKKLREMGKELCEERRCGKFLNVQPSNLPEQGLFIEANQTLVDQACHTASIVCQDNNELLVYKVLTGLLLALVLPVILLRYARPAYMAFRKRFSPQQQNRWIGPTQSQSVSYHRGQGGHLKNDTVKRESFPGLERLSVTPSREHSSNRNSDYDSYGYH